VQYHYKYVNFFLNKNKYVFCEKPPFVKTSEINKILKSKRLNMLYFNFNYQYLKKLTFVSNELSNKKNGKLISINFHSSHGLVFKKNNTWRFDKQNKIINNILGNLGIHYLFFLFNKFKKVKFRDVIFQINNKKKLIDTVECNLILNKNILSKIFLSYASVSLKIIDIYFTNSIIKIINNKIYKFFPREHFNIKKKFITPKPQIIKISNKFDTDNSLKKSTSYFINQIINKKKFNLELTKKALKLNNFLISNKLKKIILK